MVWIGIFNSEYKRQFEWLLDDKTWNALVKKHGLYDGVFIALKYNYDPVSRRRITDKSRRHFKELVDIMHDSPTDNKYKIGATKRDFIRASMSKKLRNADMKIIPKPPKNARRKMIKQMRGKELRIVGRGEYEVQRRR